MQALWNWTRLFARPCWNCVLHYETSEIMGTKQRHEIAGLELRHINSVFLPQAAWTLIFVMRVKLALCDSGLIVHALLREPGKLKHKMIQTNLTTFSLMYLNQSCPARVFEGCSSAQFVYFSAQKYQLRFSVFVSAGKSSDRDSAALM